MHYFECIHCGLEFCSDDENDSMCPQCGYNNLFEDRKS